MGLREDLEQHMAKERAIEKEQQQQRLTEATYQQMYETLYEESLPKYQSCTCRGYEQGFDRHSLFFSTFQDTYQETLPQELSPNYRSIVQEFIDLCPHSAWRRFPAQADGKKVFVEYIQKNMAPSYYIGNYRDGLYFTKVKLSDGSIHVADCDLCFSQHIEDDFFISGKKKCAKRILKEASERIAQVQRFMDGTQDYVALHYFTSIFDGFLVIFRDGLVFAPWKCAGLCPLSRPQEDFYQFLLRQLTQFTEAATKS